MHADSDSSSATIDAAQIDKMLQKINERIIVQQAVCERLIAHPEYLIQGTMRDAFNFEQIPGEIRQIPDLGAEARKLHAPYPEMQPHSFNDESTFSDAFNPYLPRPFRSRTVRAIYEKNNLSMITPAVTCIIPKIIHQIWVGPKSNARYEKIRQTWIKNHPGWLYKLWTDEELKKLKLVNRGYYDRTDNYSEKSDILRYELVYLFGGVYIDIDTECLQPLDILNHCYEFYTALCCEQEGMLNAGSMLAATPRHPILREAILSLHRNYATPSKVMSYPFNVGPVAFTRAFIHIAPKITGPVVAFPQPYFNPPLTKSMGEQAHEVVEHVSVLTIAPHTFSVHGYACDWL